STTASWKLAASNATLDIPVCAACAPIRVYRVGELLGVGTGADRAGPCPVPGADPAPCVTDLPTLTPSPSEIPSCWLATPSARCSMAVLRPLKLKSYVPRSQARGKR